MGSLPSQRRGAASQAWAEKQAACWAPAFPNPRPPRTTWPHRLTLPGSPQTWGAVVSVPPTEGPRVAPQPPGSRGHHQPLCTFNTNLSDRKTPSTGVS